MKIHNLKHIGHLDIPGGGQVYVKDRVAYIGHMTPPIGTSIVDVSDPGTPKILAQLHIPPTTHCHKARVNGHNILVVNHERYKDTPGAFRPGIQILDVSRPAEPREIAFVETGGAGVHRYDLDDRYAYISTEMEGYLGAISVIYDLADPVRPREAGRWWLPGQWTAGGEKPTWEGKRHRTHHPLRLGDRLYIGCWFGGFAIVDITDLARPRTISTFDWSPPYPHPTHTAMRMPFPLRGRSILVVSDEHTTDDKYTDPSPFLWTVDITEETNPIPIGNYIVPESAVENRAGRFGCHQPQEQVYDSVLGVTWFSGGLRLVDIKDPYQPAEVGYFIPDPVGTHRSAQSNDVFYDGHGLLYVIDRYNGLDILERRR
ncbi:MAG TPA: hypothetical protein VLH58_05155 [Candidatus Methylomirabilis sp.]|nr:hypothetical protein [Candidatus Methylomirabilis sp.]